MTAWATWVSQGAADPDAGGAETLMLAIQRNVPGELIHQQPRGKAHVRPATVQNARRCWQAEDLCAGLDLDDGSADLQNMVGARALGDPVSHLLADDLVLIGRQTLRIRMHQREGLHRDLRLVEER